MMINQIISDMTGPKTSLISHYSLVLILNDQLYGYQSSMVKNYRILKFWLIGIVILSYTLKLRTCKKRRVWKITRVSNTNPGFVISCFFHRLPGWCKVWLYTTVFLGKSFCQELRGTWLRKNLIWLKICGSYYIYISYTYHYIYIYISYQHPGAAMVSH